MQYSHLCVHQHNNETYAFSCIPHHSADWMKQSNSVLWVLWVSKICLEKSSRFFLWCAGAPICINTVLWNTIKLLFPKHAANAPESPADAILTPSSANNTALVANAVAALPMRRIGLIHAPYNPPRSALVLTQAAATEVVLTMMELIAHFLLLSGQNTVSNLLQALMLCSDIKSSSKFPCVHP